MKYSDTIIKEIAELIDCGHLCFLEKKTGKIEYYPEEIDLFFDEENPWQDIISKIESDKNSYIRIEKMNSNQSFRVMEAFLGNIKSEPLREKLDTALRAPKPFRKFKYLIDNSDYRQNWFDFKFDENFLWVKTQISDEERIEN